MDDHNKPYLRIRDLGKQFGAFTALQNIDLEVYEGEFVCFLGPSGCGKTTLLRAIAGLDVQTVGSIEQAGTDISALPPEERDFGIVFQSYALFPNITVGRNVAYGLENRRESKQNINRRVDELLELVGLSEHSGKYPSQLSGGQQQRVALARALATSPGLLLLDEPLSALDAKVRARLRLEIKSLQERLGVTTIMVTHDQEEALTMADRIVVMNHGVIEQVGTPNEIYATPDTAFVADFIGTMNFIPVSRSDAGTLMVGSDALNLNGQDIPDSGDLVVAVRPEDFEVVSAGGVNTLTSKVSTIEFLGSFVRIYLVSANDSEVTFSIDVSANRFRETDINEGGELKVRVDANHIRVYPALSLG